MTVGAAAPVSSSLVTVVVGAILGSGILGGIYVALRKFSAGTFTVVASKDLVEAARDIAGDLRRDLDEARRQIAELQEQASLVLSLKRQVERLEGELDKAKDRERLLLEERSSLRERVGELERDVARLKSSNGTPSEGRS